MLNRPSDRAFSRKPIFVALVLFSVAVVLYSLRWAVHNFALFKLSDDSGVFLYIGQQIIQGAHLYRDVWDNKPPLIFYFDAVGFLLTHSVAGVFLLCALAGAIFWLALYRALRLITPTIWAALATVLCFGGIWDLRIVPNAVENVAQPFQAIVLWVLIADVLKRGPKYGAVIAGLCTAFLVNARFNICGIGIIWLCYLALEPRFSLRERGRKLVETTAGFLGGLLLLYAPLIWSGSAPDAFQAVVLDGVRYATASTNSRWDCLWAGLYMLGFSPVSWLAGAGAALLLWTGVRGRLHNPRLAIIAGGWMVVELAMTCVSGYAFPRYFLLTLTPMALLVAVAGSEFDLQMRGWLSRIRDPHFFHRLAALATLVGATTFVGFGIYDLWTLQLVPSHSDQALGLARRLSSPGDVVATWGDVPHAFWFDLGHPSGMALFHCTGFLNRKTYIVFGGRMLDDLTSRRPALIVEKASVLPLFEPADPSSSLSNVIPASLYADWEDPGMAARKQEIKQFYEEVGREGPYVAWRRKGNGGAAKAAN